MKTYRLSLEIIGALAAAALVPAAALATPDALPGQDPTKVVEITRDFQEIDALQATLTPQEAYRRAQIVFEHFQIGDEGSFQSEMQAHSQRQTAAGWKGLLRWLDPKGFLERYVEVNDERVTIYRDAQSREIEDFTVSFAASDTALARAPIEERLEALRRNATSHYPLLGLRVAIDPGHMGSEKWDRVTGKFVRDERGEVLSEGVINLQTALILERELQALGATTMITRRGLVAVSELDYDRFDVQPFAREALRNESTLPWFTTLLASGPSGSALIRRFESSPNVTKLFANSSQNRWRYFVLGADLQARVDAIQAFRPDITLVIHYDVATTSDAPNGLQPASKNYSRTKVYMPGGVSAGELSSRANRKLLAMHAMNAGVIETSLRLNRAIVTNLSRRLGIGLDPVGGPPETRQIEPGIFARNLVISRKLPDHPTSYIECLHFNSRQEFAALTQYRYRMTIDGVETRYSDRLIEVAHAIRDGVVEWMKQ